MPPSSDVLRASALALGLGLASSPLQAQEAPTPAADAARPAPTLATGVEADAGSLYVFRGLVYSDGPVTQSKAWISAAGLSLYAWTNVAMLASGQARRLDEVDVGASYAYERGDLTVEPAINWYLYRLTDAERSAGTAAYTAEVSTTASYAIGGTTVVTRHVVDVGSYRGAYYGELGASHDHALTSDTAIGVSTWVGWASARFNHEYIGPRTAGLGLVGAGVAVTRSFGHHLYVRPHAELTAVTDATLRTHLDRPLNLTIGLAFGVAR